MTPSVDRLLTGLLALLILVAGAAAMLGLYMAAADLQASDDFLDGLGLVIGLGIVALVAVPTAVAGFALTALRQGRPTARRRVIAAGVLGALAVLPFGFFYQPLLAVMVLPVLVVAVAALDDRAEA